MSEHCQLQTLSLTQFAEIDLAYCRPPNEKNKPHTWSHVKSISTVGHQQSPPSIPMSEILQKLSDSKQTRVSFCR